ncbi:MAG: sulfur carrier protein ThiS [Gammaproteobacteria bacterium]|nr:sulfur carrier protein ThiS [Gammaproteobacteria bacterium]
MQITVNGEKHKVEKCLVLSDLLTLLQLSSDQGKLAVEINGQIVPRSQHQNYLLAEQDVIEIVQAIGGG